MTTLTHSPTPVNVTVEILEWLLVEGADRYATHDRATALAYGWYALANPRMFNPAGYVCRRLAQPQRRPFRAYLTLAQSWCDLADPDRQAICDQWPTASLYGFHLPPACPPALQTPLRHLAKMSPARLQTLTNNGRFAPNCLLPHPEEMLS